MLPLVKTPSPEQIASFEKTMAERAPFREKRDALLAQKKEEEMRQWDKEVAMLQSRVYTASVDVNIGEGDTIAVRTSLLDSEVRRMEELEVLRDRETDLEKQVEISCEMIEIVTANPIITKEWLMGNREKYSPTDLLSILLGYMEVRLKERVARIARLQSASKFRPDTEGSSVR